MSNLKRKATTIIPDSGSENSDVEELPSDVKKRAENAVNNLMPSKSKPKYEAAYDKFIVWMKAKKVTNLCDSVLLAYFDELAETHAPTSLWATYSMLRSVIHVRHNVNIHDYATLIQFLKRKSDGYAPKKAEVLTGEDVVKFIREAPDEQYLAIKVNIGLYTKLIYTNYI